MMLQNPNQFNYQDPDEEEEDDSSPVSQSPIVTQYLQHLKNQEEWSDTEWLTDDFLVA
jgi:hypothetical protein